MSALERDLRYIKRLMQQHEDGPFSMYASAILAAAELGLLDMKDAHQTSVRADPRLTAAAPELLAALKALAASGFMGGCDCPFCVALLERARAAIAKAEEA